ncbi:MAG: SDR family oxidoreductase, partial [Chloroflexi bacterium]|nr:SDR family oxidoreductase [Chloroflexota bacterium]
GIRVVTLRTGGIPETLDPEIQGREELAEQIAGASMLKRAATLEDVANVAAFVASDQARTMTAASVNISAGALVD